MSRKIVTQKLLNDLPVEEKLEYWTNGDDFDPNILNVVLLVRTTVYYFNIYKNSNKKTDTYRKLVKILSQQLYLKVMKVFFRSIISGNGTMLRTMAKAVETKKPADDVRIAIVNYLFGLNEKKEFVQTRFVTRQHLQSYLVEKGHPLIDLSNLTRIARDIPFSFKNGPRRHTT